MTRPFDIVFSGKTKINELPQLINIFLGRMSRVGPRSRARRHYELYSSEARDTMIAPYKGELEV